MLWVLGGLAVAAYVFGVPMWLAHVRPSSATYRLVGGIWALSILAGAAALVWLLRWVILGAGVLAGIVWFILLR